MEEVKPKILIISSADPLSGPGILASDYYNAYKKYGYEVDLLTKFKSEGNPEFLYVFDKSKTPERQFISACRKTLLNLYKKLRKLCPTKIEQQGSYSFFYRKEENPPVNINRLLSVINSKYDIVQIIFWQGLLSFASVQALYRKIGGLFVFSSVDYSPMSGGCHFIGDCKRYILGCGCCPAFNSVDPYDFTWSNVQYRKEVYEEVNPIVAGNSYMFTFYDRSVLLKDRRRLLAYPIIDTDLFKPLSKSLVRKELCIPNDKNFIILFGCQGVTDERKGIIYLIEGINKFTHKLTEEQRKQLLIISIGKDFDKIRSSFQDIDCKDLGYVAKETLPKVYSCADVFLCSSVNDAGPMMVDQSLCCGTPVVGFEMGACLDAVKNRGTGYCAKLKDADDFADGISYIYNLDDDQRKMMKVACLEFARKTYSYKASIDRILDAYIQYK